MFLKKERQTIKKKKKDILNIIEKKISVIKYCIFFQQFMYKNIKVSVTLTLTLRVSRGLNYFSLNTL